MIIKLIVKALKSLFSFLKKHPKAVITTAAGIGTATAAAGTYSAHKAKKINKKALQIQQEALDKHEREYQATQLVLDNLGRTEKMSSILFHVMPIPYRKSRIVRNSRIDSFR